MRFKVLGSILMILGTSLGAGMLALPVVAAHQSFLSTSVMLLLAWFVMTVGAFSLLEVSLWFPPGANLITLSRATLGRMGQGFVWFVYLCEKKLCDKKLTLSYSEDVFLLFQM